MSINSLRNSINSLSKNVLNAIKDDADFLINSSPNTDNLLESGSVASLKRGIYQNFEPKIRNTKILAPQSSILIKKKAFSTLNVNNDLRWMDKTEKFLLRATKALFAYKVQQIRAYETISKFENFYDEYNIYSLNLLYSVLCETEKLSFQQAALSDQDATNLQKFLDLMKEVKVAKDVEGKKLDLIELLKRNAFSTNNNLTTWIVDPNNIENYSTGPGTGVIELGLYSSFNTATGLASSAKGASISMQDPYNISVITSDDIEFAIEEAFYGTFNLFKGLIDGSNNLKNEFGQYPTLNSGELSSIALEAAGLGDFDSSFDMNYVRERLRVFYLGKPYINPADGVHFYISSSRQTLDYSSEKKTAYDRYVDEQELEISEIVLEAERELYTNRKISLEDYKKIRKNSDNSFKMIHVFGGYVRDTSTSYGNGSYTLAVNCLDNMGWLSWSRYAKTPGLQEYLGVLEDPLTPFQFKTDELGELIYPEGVELLQENKTLLKTGILSYNSGLFKGQNATEGNLFQGEFNDFGSVKGTKILQHPDGFIYRWKSGVLTAVADLQTADPTGRSQRNTRVFTRQYGVTAVNDIVTNLDIANILAILITGQPYNTETFLQRAYEAHNISNLSTNLNPYDPLTIILQSLKKQNYYYGNFQPYRTITLNKRSVQKQINDTALKNSINNNLKNLQNRKFKILEQIRKIKKTITDPVQNASDNILIITLENELLNINKTISSQISEARRSGIIDEQNLLSLNLNFFSGNRDLEIGEDPLRNEDITRAMMKVGSIRRIEDVRLNRDKNLFIVSDQYDYNVDLRPILLGVKSSNYNLFTSQYVDTLQACTAANNIVNFEFFCNTNGHLEFRPPEWNKTPLSVLTEATKLQNDTGRKTFPDYITKIFEDRISALQKEIQTLNISIVLAALLLGRFPDRNLIPGMTSVGTGSFLFFGVRSPSSLREEDDQERLILIGSTGPSSLQRSPSSKFNLIVDITYGDNGKLLVGDTETILGEFDPIFQEQSGLLGNLFTTAASPSSAPASKFATPENLNEIRNAFIEKVGIDPAARLGLKNRETFKKSDFFFNIPETGDEKESEFLYSRLLGDSSILSKIKQFVSERDRLVTILARNIEKKDELDEVNDMFAVNDRDLRFENPDLTDSFFPNFRQTLRDVENKLSNVKEEVEVRLQYINYLNQTAYKGSIYDHLIEDDSVNIIGYGSGKRFIIEDSEIISANYTEQPPEFTRVNVKGDAPLGIGQNFSSFTDGLYFFAGATDFDLWRQYGYSTKEIPAPFLSDSQSQCRPYAILQLQLQRVRINQASLSVVGNEFYQPGDVVYIRSKGLLYYVENVSHSFTEGQSFTTRLNLKYGHPPGVYLPSPLDVIGQQLTTDPLKDRILNYRSPTGDDEYRPLQPVSGLLFPRFSGIRNISKADLLTFKDNQARFTNMMVDLAGGIITGSRYLLLRVFVNAYPDEADAVISEAKERLNLVKSLFVEPEISEIVNDDEITLFEDLSFEGIAQDAANIGKSVLPIKTLKPLTLPNSVEPPAIPASQILMQISFLKKKSSQSSSSASSPSDSIGDLQGSDVAIPSSNSSQSTSTLGQDDIIVCLNNELADQILDENNKIVTRDFEFEGSTNENAKSYFPSGGPVQSSWLDLRDIYGNGLSGFTRGTVSRLVEIGIIDLGNIVN